MFRKRIGEFTRRRHAREQARADARLPARRPARAAASRRRAGAWLEVTKLQALAAKQVAQEVGLRSVWSWGWGRLERGRARSRTSRPQPVRLPLGAQPELCNGPAAAGAGFNASLTEGQLVFPAGTRCTLYGQAGRPSAISVADAGDRRRGRRVHRRLRARGRRASTSPLRSKQVADGRAARSWPAASAAATRATARRSPRRTRARRGARVIADELRRLAIESGFRVAGPDSRRRSGATTRPTARRRARLVATKTAAPWLGMPRSAASRSSR